MLNILGILHHEYRNEDRLCEVWTNPEGTWITRHYQLHSLGRVWKKDVVHSGHNEIWTENAAENWVLGINS